MCYYFISFTFNVFCQWAPVWYESLIKLQINYSTDFTLKKYSDNKLIYTNHICKSSNNEKVTSLRN